MSTLREHLSGLKTLHAMLNKHSTFSLEDSGSKLVLCERGGRVLDSRPGAAGPRPRGHGFEPHQRHCVVVLEQDTSILAKNRFNPGRPIPV